MPGPVLLGGGLVGVTVIVMVSLGDGITGSGSTSGALRNSSQAIRIASTMMIAIVISDIVIANQDAGRSAAGQGNGQIRNRPGRRRFSQ